LRVPTIFKWPGKIPAGQASDELIISTDIFPTVVDALGLTPRTIIEGVSLWPHVTTGEPLDRERFYWHYPHYHRTNPGSVIRDGDYKLIYYYEDNRSELYNLIEDISEANDLSGEMPEKVKELEEKLNTWLMVNRAKLPKPNEEYIETEQ
jgi:arylsulfatase A